MPTIQELKDRANAAIDRQADQLIKAAKTILNNPEPGFREFKTAKLVGEVFDSFGIAHQDGIGITGLKGYLDGATQGPTVGVMGELDSLKVQGHPHVDSETDAATPAATTARLA
jgi:metal-dependent amidase/aminoacylase/carboxypeptidase family protein